MLSKNITFVASDSSFRFHHTTDAVPRPERFPTHYEIGYELFLFLRGEGEYMIEGSRYHLEPNCLLMMNTSELHKLNISEKQPYERAVLVIQKDFMPPFFNPTVDLLKAFTHRRLGSYNMIEPETVVESGILQLFERIQSHCITGTAEGEMVAKCIVVELLSLINSLYAAKLETIQSADNKIQIILDYINQNLSEPLNLDLLAERFYLNKYHLCHIFKNATGYTINKYITYKRILLAEGLIGNGVSPTQACYMSGFNDYSNFYKACRKLTGKSPKSGFKTRAK